MLGTGGAPSKMTDFVATVALNASDGTIGLVGAVYTVSERRGQGYARCSMLLLMNDALKRHNLKTIILFTGEHNFAAQDFYESLGFTPIGHFGLLFGKWEDCFEKIHCSFAI